MIIFNNYIIGEYTRPHGLAGRKDPFLSYTEKLLHCDKEVFRVGMKCHNNSL